MSTADQVSALKAAIKFLAHAVNDAIKAKSDVGIQAKLAEFYNLVPDVTALVPQAGNLSFAGLQPADYVSLVEELSVDLVIPNAHAALIVNASVDLIQSSLPKVLVLIAAIKNVPAAPAPAQA